MASDQGGGAGGLKTYKDAYFTPKAKPGKKKGKSKSSSKDKAKTAYAASQSPVGSAAYGQVPQGNIIGNFIPGYKGPATPTAQQNPFSGLSSSGYTGGPGPGYGLHENLTPMRPASQATPLIGGIAAGAAGGALGGAGNPPRPQTPEELLAALTQGYPGGGTTDWNALAAKIYDPQVDYLNEIEARAKKRAAASGKAITGVYDALGQDIAGQAGNIKSDYAAADKSSDAAYQQAMSQTKAGFDDSRNGVADTLQRLGIEEAAPNTTGQQSDMQGLMQSIIATQDQAQDNLLTAGKQSDLGYNEAMVSGSALKGGDAQYGLSTQLNGFLNDLGLKRADLATQMAQYAAQGQSTGDQQAYDRWRDQRDFKYKVESDAAALAAKAQEATGAGGEASVDLNKLDPIGQLNAMALNIYGNERGAGNAVKAITDTVSRWGADPQKTSLKDFVDIMVAHNPQADHVGGDIAALKQLAVAYWNRFNNKVTPDNMVG